MQRPAAGGGFFAAKVREANVQFDGAILAGGQGTRMAGLANAVPKALLPVGNEPLISHHMSMMRSMGIGRVFIVIGHLGNRIAEYVGDGSRWGVRVRFIEQRNPLGTAHAALLLEESVTTNFVLLMGDVYFEIEDADALLRPVRSGAADGVLGAKWESDEALIHRNFAIFTGPDGAVRKVVEKPLYDKSSLKGCGVYVFTPFIFDAIRRTPRTAMRDEYEITHSIQIFISDGRRVTAPAVVSQDVNLTTPADVLRCNLLFLEKSRRGNLIDPAAKVNESAVLDRCAVGAGASIGPGVKLSRCVVFEGSQVSNIEVSDAIITPGAIIRC